MEKKVRQFCQEYGIKKGQSLLLAVSGGKDSIAMLHCFHKMGDFFMAVGHFDHQSRGGDSTLDAQFVEKYVSSLGLRCYLGTAKVEEVAKNKKQGFEAMARQLRYDFLEKTAKKTKADWILTAHQAEDNVETFLLHFCRGAGLQGLGGIAPVRGNIARPLLQVSRQEISDYVGEFQLPFREDLSNFDLHFRRNYVRHEILPHMAKLNPQYWKHGSNTMSIIQQENQFLEDYVKNLVDISEEKGFRVVKKAEFETIPPALRLRWLPHFTNSNLSYANRQALLEKLEGEHFGDLLIYQVETGEILPDFPQEIPPHMEIPLQTPLVWGKWRVFLDIAPCPLEGEKDCIYLTKTETLFLRTRREGDKIRVAGRSHYKLKKFMQQEKIPPWQRDFVPLVTNQADFILCVGHLAVAEGVSPEMGENCWVLRLGKL